jgi:hypothetical protein
MKSINEIPNYELVFKLRKLTTVAKELAYAKSNEEAEYITLNYLRPLLKETEDFLNPKP